jgi:hypothetical protein
MTEATQKRFIWMIGIIMVVGILSITGVVSLGLELNAHRPKTVVKTKTKIITRTVAIAEPRQRNHDPVGAMTAAEFNFIRKGAKPDYLHQMFGLAPGNAVGDFQDWWPAVGGGRYVVHYHNDDHDLAVDRKWYES